ncbi:MAG: methyltransferase domain-containing protein [Clostridia bacterium]|nr:methyltransferase domain-containing protein [Clostridia bacterium]
MYLSILDLLCCPSCRGALVIRDAACAGDEVINGKLQCSCGNCYPVVEGVVDFHATEQTIANAWSDLDEQALALETPEADRARQDATLRAIADRVAVSGAQVLLDIACGVGRNLEALCRTLPQQTEILAVDLSAYVLHYDRKRFKELAPARRISYLACDATCLPIREGVLDAAATYEGFSNMPGVAHVALREAHRVLKTGGVLVSSFCVIARNSRGCERMKQYFSQHDIHGAEEFYLSDGCILPVHEEMFSRTESAVAVEGNGAQGTQDLIPYPGEWFAEWIVTA